MVTAEGVLDVRTRRRFDTFLVAALADRLGAQVEPPGVLFLVGADRVDAEVLDSLVAAASAVDCFLVLVFENLRGAGRELLGRGDSETVILKLGNHDDATAAADHIGKDHLFIMSSMTKTAGETQGESTTRSFTESTSRTTSFLDAASNTAGTSTSTSSGSNSSENRSYAEATTRSEEFRTRPEAIQQLPDTSLVYVAATSGRRVVALGDCHPALIGSKFTSDRPLDRGPARERDLYLDHSIAESRSELSSPRPDVPPQGPVPPEPPGQQQPPWPPPSPPGSGTGSWPGSEGAR